MRELYPALTPFSSEMLDVGNGHRVYLEQCGNPNGLPVVFLHGGPGSGCKPDHRQFFDPARYHVIIFDQRGSGRSEPAGEVSANTTDLLVSDMELIRERLHLDAWVLFGGSWGATLALAYAEAHPERVLGMVLRGSFLARKQDVRWFFADGANHLLPRQWQRFVDSVGLTAELDPLALMYAQVFSDDEAVVNRAAAAWEQWSGAVVMFSIDQAGGDANQKMTAQPTASPSAIHKARIEMHYAHHAYFMQENALLEGLQRIPDVPVTIVHGARDLTCPAESAWLLHQGIAGSKLEILRTAGHLSSEKPMIDALVRASDSMADALL